MCQVETVGLWRGVWSGGPSGRVSLSLSRIKVPATGVCDTQNTNVWSMGSVE